MPKLTPVQIKQLREGLPRLISTGAFRSCKSSAEKAVRAAEELNLPLGPVADALRVSRSCVQRARRAISEGRDVCKAGRPRALSDEEEDRLEALLARSSKENKPVPLRKFKSMVRSSIPL